MAPPLTMLFHDQLVAQVWALIPTMLLALFLRARYQVVLARVLCVALAALSTTALILAPAQAPLLWAVFYVVCILGPVTHMRRRPLLPVLPAGRRTLL